MTSTGHLGLPYIDAAQSQKHVTHNEALRGLDMVVHLSVLSRNVVSPPVSPGADTRYLIGTAAIGVFAGYDGYVAAFQDGAWSFKAPQTGWRMYIETESSVLIFDGAVWRDLGWAIHALDNLSRCGVGTAADVINPLSAKLNAALFTARGVAESGTGDMRFKLNKEAATNVLSQLYQTNYSGRAEVGLIGNDHFHIKVSSDGAVWKDALDVDPVSGAVNFPNGATGVSLPPPAFQWSGTQLRFQNPDSSWGAWVNLQGVAGPPGATGATGTVGATGPAGATGPVGAVGVAGATGAMGPAGAIGPGGAVGVAGATGVAGNTVLNGAGAPPVANGVNGDFYIDKTNWRVYGPKAVGIWPGTYTAMIGAPGSQILTTSGAPSAGTGANGDYAVDQTAKNIYGPKAAGAWPPASSFGGMTLKRVDVFTTSGTFTKQIGDAFYRIIGVGGAGGGGSGARSASGTAACGGGGGGGAPLLIFERAAQDVTATVSVTVGAGGIGGATVLDSSNGNDGLPGGWSSFGSYGFFDSGSNGYAGTALIGGGGGGLRFGGTPLPILAGNGGFGGSSAAGLASAYVDQGPSGGGGGGGISAANVAFGGGNAGGSCYYAPVDGAVLTAGGAVNASGTAGGTTSTNYGAGAGGGGAGASVIVNNGNGGSGGLGAGGGGGGGRNGFTGGAGGNGGNGRIVVIVFG